MTSWDDLRRKFEIIALRKGIAETARRVPMGRTTAYRIIHGQKGPPSLAIRVAVARIVAEEEKPK